MNLRVSFSAICCFIAVIASSLALAQDMDDVEKRNGDTLAIAEQPQRPTWEASFETTWLPGSKIHGTGGDLVMGEVKTGFTKRFSITPQLELSTGLHYSLREIDAPETARLPESLQTLSLNLAGEYHATDSLTLGLRVSPGLSSDFKMLTSDDARVPVVLLGTYQASKTLFLRGGVAYTGQKHAFPFLPVMGALYLPTEKWALGLGFPRTGVIYKPKTDTEYYISGEFVGGEYRLHDASIGANIISYWDYRAVAGVEFPLSSFARLGIAGGYAFARRFVFYEGNRNDLDLDNAPFGRLELKLSW